MRAAPGTLVALGVLQSIRVGSRTNSADDDVRVRAQSSSGLCLLSPVVDFVVWRLHSNPTEDAQELLTRELQPNQCLSMQARRRRESYLNESSGQTRRTRHRHATAYDARWGKPINDSASDPSESGDEHQHHHYDIETNLYTPKVLTAYVDVGTQSTKKS